MKKINKLKLVKVIVVGTIVANISSSLFSSTKKETNIIPYTQNEIEYLKTFESELEQLEMVDEIKFKNKELFYIVSDLVDGQLTTENIKEIKELSILIPLKNEDLSDLKYLTNLRYLYIKDNLVDLSYLEYNQKLYSVSFQNCFLYNSSKLPNSIKLLYLRESDLLEYTLSTPYNLERLNIQYSPISSLYFKNPDSLKDLCIVGGVFFSVTDLLNCNNLKYINLQHCYDIKDAEFLTELPNLDILRLSELAAIYLDEYSLDKLPIAAIEKKPIKEYINKLDEIANTLNDENLSDEDKIKNITTYLTDKYDYNKGIYNEKTGRALSLQYNRKPISESFKSNYIICINYTCLFQALANRLNIDSMIITNDNHGWNYANFDGEYKGIDITNIDNATPEEEKLRYKFNTKLYDPLYSGAIYPKRPSKVDTTIGYINKDEQFEVKDILYTLSINPLFYDVIEVILIFGISFLSMDIIEKIKYLKELEKQEKEEVKKYVKK